MIGSHFNVCHVDEGALDWAIEKWNIRSFVDIGCGTGKMVDLARSRGIEAWGVDGDPQQKRKNIVVFDFRDRPFILGFDVDLGWSVEFVEHVEEEHVYKFMSLFRACKRVIFSHALPPNAPPGHVNCQKETYWIRTFAQWGFVHSWDLSMELREASSMEREFLRNTGKVFVRR